MKLEVGEPGRDCPLCPRLVQYRAEARAAEPKWFNAPVPSFGPHTARLAIIGLAPGLKGANRTGRPFTGDYAGDLLYRTLLAHGFAKGRYGASPDDGLRLTDCRIINAVRCVPPQNKPTPLEIKNCRSFLAASLGEMPRLGALMALGRIAHESVIAALGGRAAAHKFAHGAVHVLSGGVRLYDSYHCSRYNTNTGRLTTPMFEAVVAAIKRDLD
jgi:uracil-DNA glycosylase family 4